MKKEFKSVKRSIVLALSVMLVGFLVGCGGEAEVTPEPSATSEEVSETVSEVVSEEISEIVSEEPSEEVVEEVDYSITAVDATINEITQAYPNEDPRQIAAVVIGTNAKYMTEQEIDEVLNAYGFSKEEINQLYLDYFNMKFEVVNTLNQIAEGATFDEVPDYSTLSPIYVYCLNPQEYDECYKLEEEYLKCIENHVSTGNDEYIIGVGQNEGSSSIARMLVISPSVSLGFMDFENYDECIPFAEEYAKTLEQA